MTDDELQAAWDAAPIEPVAWVPSPITIDEILLLYG